MNELQVDTYRSLVRKECDEMIVASEIWKRTDINRDEKLRLFNEAQIRIRQYELDAQVYIDSIVGGLFLN